MKNTELNFGPGMKDFGKEVLREVVKTDYGKGATFNGVKCHPTRSHGGHGPHEQTTLFKEGVSGSHIKVRFLK